MGDRYTVVLRLSGVTVEFGGEEHSGWLPPGAAHPLSTPVEVAVVDFEIVRTSGGFLFEYYSRDTRHHGDTWHETMEDALDQARHSFGIQPELWQPVEEGPGRTTRE